MPSAYRTMHADMSTRLPSPAALLATVSFLLLVIPGAGHGQESGTHPDEPPVALTVGQAIEAALAGNRHLAAANERASAARLSAQAEMAFLLPAVEATAGAVRTNDPVGVFGTKLRQRRFEAADLELAALNNPAAVTDWSAGIGASWQVAQPYRWVARQAADARSDAADAARERTRDAVVHTTRVLFAKALQAEAVLTSITAADSATRATLGRVESRLAEGLATEADLLQARASVAEVEAEIGGAEAALFDTRDALAAHLGLPEGAELSPRIDTLWDDLLSGASTVSPPAPAARSDLAAGRATVDAARAEARSVSARRLPALEAFGALSTNSPSVGGAIESNWTVGVQLSVPLFTGSALTRTAEAAHANARALQIEQDQREQDASAEIRSATRAVAAARSASTAASAAASAAAEASRLLQRRYEEGMVTISDLLQAQARAARLDAGAASARANLAIAVSTLDFVSGVASTPTRRSSSEAGR